MKHTLPTVVIALVLLVAGYFFWQSQTPRPGTPGDVSVTVQTSGGFCVVPGCPPHAYVISKNGISTDGGEPRAISAGQYDRLVSLVRGLDERSFPKKAEGRLCPSAYDGNDVQYAFVDGSRTLHADNCEDEVSADHPLIKLINELIYP